MAIHLTIMYAVRRQLVWLLLALAVAMPSHAASWRDDMPRATALGSGELTWLGIRVYDTTLWSEHKPFDPNKRFALELTYHRSIKREQLVTASMNEIRRLFPDRYNADQLQRWQDELSRAFVDVRAGDQLIGVYLPDQGCRFYSKQNLIADFKDPELAKAFFAIWLDERTKERGLRAQLLGAKS